MPPLASAGQGGKGVAEGKKTLGNAHFTMSIFLKGAMLRHRRTK